MARWRYQKGIGRELRPWLNDPYAYDQAVQAAVKVLEALRPPGEIRVPALPLTPRPDSDWHRFLTGCCTLASGPELPPISSGLRKT
jgi:hypothetical protein